MGREMKRVPLEFAWPIGTIWWGYQLESVPCLTCKETGKVPWAGDSDRYCPHCEGEKRAYPPPIEVPDGPGWQMWETTSEGSPISPVFETPEALAHWLADTGASSFGWMTSSYEGWLGKIGA